MNRDEEFIKQEKDRYGKMFVDITYAIDDVSPFLDEREHKERKYITKLPILKKYMELLSSAEKDAAKRSGFSKFFSDDKYVNLLNSYKKDNEEALNQLEHCKNCVYLNNKGGSKFDGCLGCRQNSRIVYNDDKINVTFHDNFTLDLTNDNTGDTDRYKVLATLQDVELDRKYIIIENIRKDEKFILYYYPGIAEDSYGEISDPEEFDFVVSTFEGVDQ